MSGAPFLDCVCLDLEGVLVPEIWLGLAERSGLADLRATTREIPVYEDLMRHRIETLRQHGLKMADLVEVAGTIEPLDGATAFMDWLRARFQVAILSDSFYELTGPLMAQLKWPTLLCHHLVEGDDGEVSGYQMRQPDPKRRVVEALRSLNCRVIAAGDSYNDLSMLAAADVGALFRAPDEIAEANPALPALREYAELATLCAASASLPLRFDGFDAPVPSRPEPATRS